MLSPYDELPVHQTSQPLSVVSDTNTGFDDGYYFGAFSAEAKTFCFQGLRISPNTDLIGGYVGLNRDGLQRTVRFSRTWREKCELEVGPYRITVVEPYRHIRLELAPNESGLSCSLDWFGMSPAYLEAHHLATNRGRPTTDQSRYSQPGTVEGWIELDGERIEVGGPNWYGSRDHSWGVYFERPPIAPNPQLLPPPAPEGVPRSLRFWTLFGSGDLSGFYAIHEDARGRQVPMNDTFGTPFEGRLVVGWDQETYELVSGRCELELVPGTRLLRRGRVILHDADDGEWVQEVEPACPPWITSTIGYQAGSWRDGGSMRTYHGPGVSLEWDDVDARDQPFDHVRHDGVVQRDLIGKEYLVRTRTIAPDGREWSGAGQTELFLDGPYAPLGL
ncbi:hypothetical protein NWF34_17970 [Gordonia sp. GONU]|uniref:hypothetical protein n=1 Tax=Gordonia TaxID=2053 RepID=UPI0004145ED5|nr:MULTISPECIES: hypothetical protein [Gordonia]MCR8898837.1 hypothetical protein [Gordonia sp. GONU]MCZ4650530.1 hypothetical protein [Gordonia amicalis]